MKINIKFGELIAANSQISLHSQYAIFEYIIYKGFHTDCQCPWNTDSFADSVSFNRSGDPLESASPVLLSLVNKRIPSISSHWNASLHIEIYRFRICYLGHSIVQHVIGLSNTSNQYSFQNPSVPWWVREFTRCVCKKRVFQDYQLPFTWRCTF